MPNKNHPNQNQNQSHSDLEDDIKAPSMDQPGKRDDADDAEDEEGNSTVNNPGTGPGMRDGDGALDEEDEEVTNVEGDQIDEGDRGGKPQPR